MNEVHERPHPTSFIYATHIPQANGMSVLIPHPQINCWILAIVWYLLVFIGSIGSIMNRLKSSILISHNQGLYENIFIAMGVPIVMNVSYFNIQFM